MRALLCLLLLSYSFFGKSQNLDLQKFNEESQRITRGGMRALSTWGAGNLLVNGILAGRASGSDRAFYQMNMAWGGVDLVLGGIGLLGTRRVKTVPQPYETLLAQHRLEKVFLLNAGLDVAYVTGGFYLLERAKARPTRSERNDGYGRALVLQGGFLLLFDGALYALHRAHFNHRNALWQKLELADSQLGLKLTF